MCAVLTSVEWKSGCGCIIGLANRRRKSVLTVVRGNVGFLYGCIPLQITLDRQAPAEYDWLMEQQHVTTKAKLALALGLLGATVMVAPAVKADDNRCPGCGDYSGTSGWVGNCFYLNVFAICQGGVCNQTISACQGQPANISLYCTCGC